ncbi:MAG: nucleotidyltransferase domain-containing protein [Rhodocyclaceae bacterium]|nr:nucleotidyltransferase domain-containing protein [Rhodocyclaceae bacterium]
MIPEQTILQAAQMLGEAAKPAKPAKVILFGSYASGDARENSDLDFLVIESELQDALGQLNDLASAGELLMSCADADPRLREAVTLIGGWHGPRHHKLLKAVPAGLKQLGRLRLPKLTAHTLAPPFEIEPRIATGAAVDDLIAAARLSITHAPEYSGAVILIGHQPTL